MVTPTAKGRLQVHRLVQAVTRDQLDEDQAATWSRRALRLIAAVFPAEPDNPRSWSVCASVAPHIEAVTMHAERYPGLANERGHLLGRLGIYLSASAHLKESLIVIESVLAIEQDYRADHFEVDRLVHMLGIFRQELDNRPPVPAALPVARDILIRALTVIEATHGPGHPVIHLIHFTLHNLEQQMEY